MDVGWVAAVLGVIVGVGGAVTIGGLVVALFLVPGHPARAFAAAASASLRATSRAAVVWAVGLVVLGAMDGASWTGPVAAGAALLVAVGAATAQRWLPAATLLVPAGTALLLPLADTATGPRGDLAAGAQLWVVTTTSVWAGVSLAVLPAVRRGRHDLALGRYGRAGGAGWVLLVVFGTVLALVSTGGSASLLAVGAGAVAMLGAIAVPGHRRTLRTAAAPADRAPVRLMGAQAALLLVLIAVTATVTRTPAPPAAGPLEAATGYLLPGPPTWENLLTTWRPDLVLGPVAALAALAYLAGVRRLRRGGRPWPAGHTAAWLVGCGLVLLATSSGVGVYAPAVFSVHMVLHMVLNMVAPLALVLGAPVTLALRALPVAATGGPAGPHEWLLALTGSPLARVLAHPGLAAVLFAGSYYLLYLTGLFEAVIAEHWSRTLLNAAVLAIGYQFCWLVAGPDAAPRRLPHLGRLGLGFAVMPFHVLFAIILISMPTAVAAGFYDALALPWPTDLLADQQRAGLVSLVVGEAVLIATQVVLLVQWHRHDQFATFRADPLDEDATAYRDLLATLERHRRGAPPGPGT